MYDTVDTIVVNSRGDTNPEWLREALHSVKRQSYKTGLIVIDNRDKSKSIGKCWNDGAYESTADWIFYLDDDDFITEDYIHSLMTQAYKYKERNPHCFLSYITAFDGDGKYSRMDKCSKGIIRREYILNHPFDEGLKSGVDRCWWEAMQDRKESPMVVPYHYGYYYRQHENNTCNGWEITDG